EGAEPQERRRDPPGSPPALDMREGEAEANGHGPDRRGVEVGTLVVAPGLVDGGRHRRPGGGFVAAALREVESEALLGRGLETALERVLRPAEGDAQAPAEGHGDDPDQQSLTDRPQ